MCPQKRKAVELLACPTHHHKRRGFTAWLAAHSSEMPSPLQPFLRQDNADGRSASTNRTSLRAVREDVCYGPLVSFSFWQTLDHGQKTILFWASEEPGKGTETLPEGGSGGEPYGRYWKNLGGILMAGRELVRIHHPKCSLQDEVLAPSGPDHLPLSHISPCCRTSAISRAHRPALPTSRSTFAGLLPWPCHQKQTFSKAQLMRFLKAFPNVPTHAMLGITKAFFFFFFFNIFIGVNCFTMVC